MSQRPKKDLGFGNIIYEPIRQAKVEDLGPQDFFSTLISDELLRREDQSIKRRIKRAKFRDNQKRLDNFDFGFNPKIPKKKIFDLCTSRFIEHKEDVLFLGKPGTGKSHLAQSIGFAAIQKGYNVAYKEAHIVLEELGDAELEGRRKDYLQKMMKFELLIIDDLGMRKLPRTAAEEMLELIMRRHERCSTIITSNRPIEDWGKMLGDTAAVTALLDRLLHHGHVIECGPKSFRTQNAKRLKPDEQKDS